LQRGVPGEIPTIDLLVDDWPNLPRPGVGSVRPALVAELGGNAHVDRPMPRLGNAHARANVVADPLIALGAAIAGEHVEPDFEPVVDTLRDFERFVEGMLVGADAIHGDLRPL